MVSARAAWRAIRITGLLGWALSAGLSAPSAAQPASYTLTIYVDEGRGQIAGHVFVQLSDGHNNLYRGFYPKEAVTDPFGRITGPLGVAGGEIRDDAHHHWDVKDTFVITKDEFRSAIVLIEEIRNSGAKWCLTNHCGDFALAVAKTAGVSIDLPTNLALKDRPGAVAKYLLQHGGVTRESAVEDCKANVTRTTAAGEITLGECGGCSAAEKQEHIAQLRRFRDNDLKACSLIGLSPDEKRRASTP
jgi:hypothetical protein